MSRSSGVTTAWIRLPKFPSSNLARAIRAVSVSHSLIWRGSSARDFTVRMPWIDCDRKEPRAASAASTAPDRRR